MKHGTFFTTLLVLATLALTVVAAPDTAKDQKEFAANTTTALIEQAKKVGTGSCYNRAVAIRGCIRKVTELKNVLSQAQVKSIEDELLKSVTQEQLNKLLDFKEECRFDYASGIQCPDNIGMNRFYAMYDVALKKSGRKTAYAIFKKTNGKTYDSYGVFQTKFFTENMTTVTDVIAYMSEELYYPIDPLATVVANELIRRKYRQLVDDGYSIVYTSGKEGRKYSEGAELLLTYCNKLVDAFNAPYFLGLNARLEEVGFKERFNNKVLPNPPEARKIFNGVLYNEMDMNEPCTRWMLRVTAGVSDFNALVDRINNGSEAARKAAAESKGKR